MIFMNKKGRGYVSIMKIIGVSLIFILIFGASVMATEINLKSVEITMANGYKMDVVTTKTNVSEILSYNNIISFKAILLAKEGQIDEAVDYFRGNIRDYTEDAKDKFIVYSIRS